MPFPEAVRVRNGPEEVTRAEVELDSEIWVDPEVAEISIEPEAEAEDELGLELEIGPGVRLDPGVVEVRLVKLE